jgi:uracil-DNA glycosylase
MTDRQPEPDTRFHRLLADVSGCRLCTDLPLGPNPVLQAHPAARILIVGQAPGTKVHNSRVPWDDPSGTRLRQWLQLDRDLFYDERWIAIMPIGFCYPGKTGTGDKPPQPRCAPLWHPPLRAHLPCIETTLLIGAYAQAYYLGDRRKASMTDTVTAWPEYWPHFVPMPHPSWHNTSWLKKNPWFEAELLPELRAHIRRVLGAL